MYLTGHDASNINHDNSNTNHDTDFIIIKTNRMLITDAICTDRD